MSPPQHPTSKIPAPAVIAEVPQHDELPWALRLLSPATRIFAAMLLLGFGVQLWLVGSTNYGPTAALKATALAFVLSLIPPINRLLQRIMAMLDCLYIDRPRLMSIGVGVLGMAILYFGARWEGRAFVPRIHDELQFLLQARFLANGVLWMPPHPLADFFDTFYVLRTPVYAPQSFPGWPLMLVPSLWLGLSPWVTPFVVTGAALTVSSRLIGRAVGGAMALAAILFMCGLWATRMNSIVVMAHTPALFMGVLSVWSFWHWYDAVNSSRPFRATAVWAIGVGAFTAWAGLTRPIDGLCYAVPVGAMLALSLSRLAHRRVRVGALTIAFILIGSLPFVSLQLAMNKGITGSFTRTPFQLYNEIDQPALSYGDRMQMQTSDAIGPASTLPQKIAHYRNFIERSVKEYNKRTRVGRLVESLSGRYLFALPIELLVIVVPPCLLMLGTNRAWLLVATVPIFIVGYSTYPIAGPHYPGAIATGMAVLFVLGIEGFSAASGRYRTAVRASLVLTTLTLTTAGEPPFDRLAWDEMGLAGDMGLINEKLNALPGRAIVLFVPDVSKSFTEEPVYNLDVVWPDDARVIRAQDLGVRDPELYAYYAQRQPTRVVYRYDRLDESLVRLGVVADLANEATTTTTTRPNVSQP